MPPGPLPPGPPVAGPAPGPWRRARQLFVRWGPLLLPPFYLAVVLWLQPPDYMGPPDQAPWLARMLWDDFDDACMALRGLNAGLGRRAGRTELPPYPETE